MNKSIIYAILFLSLAAVSCDRNIEPVPQRFITPAQQDPVAWAEYMADLATYKSSEHRIACARFDNAPETVQSEKDCLRSLPDSLDIVVLARPLSEYDREDLPVLQEKSTKVLLEADCSDLATAVSVIDKALADIASDGLDGLVIRCVSSAETLSGEVINAIMQKLSFLKDKTLVFTGNVTVIPESSRSLFDFYLVDASKVGYVYNLMQNVSYTTGYFGIPKEKILPVVAPSSLIIDIDNKEKEACPVLCHCTISEGWGGVLFTDASFDYYGISRTYPDIRCAIDILNPAYDK